MKAYVIKRDDGKYYKSYNIIYQENRPIIEFTDNILSAKIFETGLVAYNCMRDIELEIGDCCEVVPVTIVEGDIEVEKLEKKVEELREISAYEDLENNGQLIDGVFFTNEQIFALQRIDAIREFNQNQVVIEQLEKVKKHYEEELEISVYENEAYNKKWYGTPDYYFGIWSNEILSKEIKFINQQINELKGEK